MTILLCGLLVFMSNVHNPFYWIIKTQCGNIIEIVKLVVFRARLGHAYIRFSTRVYIIYTRNTYTSVRP